jgi:Domain of unknown function DUF29
MAMANNLTPAASADGRSLYDRDYYTWALKQAQALKKHRIEGLDWENLAEEVEDLARSEKRELRNRLKVLLAHLLKWKFQPKRRSRSWEATIAVQRAELRLHLRDNPGLKSSVPTLLADAYETARVDVATRLAGQPQPPQSCPWSFEQIMDERFRPDWRLPE